MREKVERKCSVEGCSTRHAGHGYCQAHLIRFKKYGDATANHPKHRSNLRWIEEHKDYAGDDCLIWPFHRSENGRGLVGQPPNRMSAPRAMCCAAHGAPPDEKAETAHSCGNGHLGCMNPKHLRWASHMENVKDRADHGRDRKGVEINTAKLDDQKVLYIRSCAGKRTGKSLAAEFGVSEAAISSILRRKTWAWLEQSNG